MARVTLEGSITPSTFLARGKRMTVERTDFIDKLIRKGFVNVVPDPDAKTEVESITAPRLAAAKAEKAVQKTARKPARKRVTKPKDEPAEPILESPLPFDEGGLVGYADGGPIEPEDG
jgi:hypothetical protein